MDSPPQYPGTDLLREAHRCEVGIHRLVTLPEKRNNLLCLFAYFLTHKISELQH